MTDLSTSTPDKPRREPKAPGTVTATELAAHLDMTRQRVATLADVDHVLERLPNGGFNLDAARTAWHG